MQPSSRHDDPGQILAVRDASRRLVRELGLLERARRSFGLSHAQCHALLEIERAGGATVSELADVLALDKSAASRTAASLVALRLASARRDRGDGRKKRLFTTAAGRRRLAAVHAYADERVGRALAVLAPHEREQVIGGLSQYARALRRARLEGEVAIRPIRESDDPVVAALIRDVMTELGASGPGFAIHDAEVAAMSAAYADARSAYFVVERAGRVVGGAGFGPLEGGPRDTCELRKMYFRAEARGLGAGSRLLDLVLEHAARAGFRRCYLETLARMKDARRLYERKGFVRIEAPLGRTGHFGCTDFYLRPL